MTPDFRILANGANVTATFRDRLVSLEVVDEDGDKADRVTIVVDNRDDLVELPAMDTTIDVWLGYREIGLTKIGRYGVDGRGGEGPVQLLSVRATAADMKGAIRAPRTRTWENRTLSEIVRTIAGEAGLRAVVSGNIASTRWRYLAQTAESNLHFLRRIAGTIEAEWGDPDRSLRELLTIGEGDPVVRLRHLHTTEDEARRAAEAEHQKRGRGEVWFTAELARFSPDLVAGARLTLSGVSSKVDGQWDVVRVTHTLANGLRSRVEARRGGQE